MNFFLGKYTISDGQKPVQVKLTAPIEWIPLDSHNGIALVVSRNVVDWEMYMSDLFLKKYLNETLYDHIFSDKEKEVIVERNGEKLFLLSEDEILKYFPDFTTRRAKCLFVKNEDDVLNISFEHMIYWLKNKGDGREAPAVDPLGNFCKADVYSDEIGIRPAMFVEERKAKYLTAVSGYNDWRDYWWNIEEF